MRYFFFILIFFCISIHASPQGLDTSIIFQNNAEETLQTLNDNKNYIFFKIDNTQQADNIKSKIDKFSIIIDPSRETAQPSPITGAQKSTKAIIVDTKDESENSDKRIATGPSQYDSRIEIRNLNPLIDWQQKVLINARSVAVIIEKNMMHPITDSIYQLDISSTLGKQYNLCPGEAFRDQPVVGVGTAFITDDMTMMTAGHVFTGQLKDYVIVFGFEMINKVGAYEAFINIKDIYNPTEITFNSDELDVSVFKVDRPLDNPPLKWAGSKAVPLNTSVYMVGHPMGLPKKAALNASIKKNNDTHFFYTSLDAFQGNSGSPVFRLDTHEVIGILVSGELDYKWNGSCNASTLCAIPYCKGEKVMRIENILNELNQK